MENKNGFQWNSRISEGCLPTKRPRVFPPRSATRNCSEFSSDAWAKVVDVLTVRLRSSAPKAALPHFVQVVRGII